MLNLTAVWITTVTSTFQRGNVFYYTGLLWWAHYYFCLQVFFHSVCKTPKVTSYTMAWSYTNLAGIDFFVIPRWRLFLCLLRQLPIPIILWEPTFCYHVHYSPLLLLSWARWNQSTSSHPVFKPIFKLCFLIIRGSLFILVHYLATLSVAEVMYYHSVCNIN